MDPMKIVVPHIEDFGTMSYIISQSLFLTDETREGLEEQLRSFTYKESDFETYTDSFLSRINAEINRIESEIAKRDQEISDISKKISNCDNLLLQYDKTAETIDNEKMSVSDEIEELDSNCSAGEDGQAVEETDISDQKQHMSELDEQYLQLLEDRQRVTGEKTKQQELLSQKKTEKSELLKKNEALKDKESTIRTRYMSVLTSYRAMLAQIDEGKLLDSENPVLQDAKATGAELDRIKNLLFDLVR